MNGILSQVENLIREWKFGSGTIEYVNGFLGRVCCNLGFQIRLDLVRRAVLVDRGSHRPLGDLFDTVDQLDTPGNNRDQIGKGSDQIGVTKWEDHWSIW